MSANIDALVASPWWEWLAGMLAVGLRSAGTEYRIRLEWTLREGATHTLAQILRDCRPDIEDPAGATQGCMLALVRKAYAGCRIEIEIDPSSAQVMVAVHTRKPQYFHGTSLGIALTAAMLAAPEPSP
jgi:hypothetical protein